MKHLLIIISFLLLSSPVIGDNHKGETLYGWGECCDYVWKGFGDKETHPKYNINRFVLQECGDLTCRVADFEELVGVTHMR